MKNKIISTQYIYLIATLICISSCSSVIRSQEQIEAEEIRQNKLSRILEYKTIFNLGISGKEVLSSEVDFDKLGNKLKEYSYSEDGSPYCTIDYTYNQSGLLSRTLCENPKKNMIFRIDRTYDQNDFRKDLVYFLPDGSFKYRNLAVCDDEGKILQLKWFRSDGLKAINKYVYFDGKKISDTEFDPNGKITYKWDYKYDNKGLLIKALQSYEAGIINASIDYKYNEKDLLIKQINYSSGSDFPDNFTGMKYNSNNLLIEKNIYSGSGRLQEKNRYKYVFY